MLCIRWLCVPNVYGGCVYAMLSQHNEDYVNNLAGGDVDIRVNESLYGESSHESLL